LQQPPPLRDFLAAGCNPASVPGLAVAHLLDLIDDISPDRAAVWAGWYGDNVDAWIHGQPSEMDLVSTVPRVHIQAELCEYAWAADALDDPALAAVIVGLTR